MRRPMSMGRSSPMWSISVPEKGLTKSWMKGLVANRKPMRMSLPLYSNFMSGLEEKGITE